MPRSFALAPDPAVDDGPPVAIPSEWNDFFCVMQAAEDEFEMSVEPVVLVVPNSRHETLLSLCEVTRRAADERDATPCCDGQGEEMSRYLNEVVLKGRGLEEDLILVELLAAADFTGCLFVSRVLSQHLMRLIRSSDEATVSGRGRPISLQDRLEVLGELPLLHHLSGR
jgi:hypothetical protein